MTVEPIADNIIPQNDRQRLEALHRFRILYTESEEAFDNITRIMAEVFDTPMSFISLVDEEKVYYKSQVGPFGRDHVRREDSLCSHTILGTDPLIIEDAKAEAFLAGNPYVSAEGGIRFYAGAPLITKDGFQIGTACVVDIKQKKFSDKDKNMLVRFAKLVMHEIELRLAMLKQAEIEDRLMTSYKELQFVTDTMPQLVWATEPDGYSFFFNKGWLDYTGLTFDQVKGDGWAQSVHPDDMDRSLKAWRTAVETGNTYDVEYRLRKHDGEYRWFVARGTPMKDENGKVIKWYGTSTDIEGQKKVQQDFQQEKERFDLVSKATQDAIWDWNLRTNDIWWNEGFKELFGYKAEEIEPTIVSWYNRVHPDDRDRVVGGIHKVIDNGSKQWSDEYRFRKRDGSYAIVFDRGYALHDETGTPYRMLGSMQDVTIRRQQQLELKTSEQRFQAAVEAVEGVLWTNNAEGKMEGEQAGWSSLTGQSYEEYSGYGWAKAVHPEDAQATVDAWNDAVRERKMFVFRHRLKTKDGHWRMFSVRAVPVFQNDAIKEWVGVHTDITEQWQAEEKIRHSEQRFQNLVREATVGIIVLTGEDMCVEVVNDAYGRLIGRKAKDLINRKLFDIIPEAEEPFRGFLDNVRTSGEPVYLFDQYYRVYADGETIDGYLNIVYQPYKEVDGTTTGVMVLCQDVTPQVIARKKIERAEETARLAIASAELGTFDVDLVTNHMEASERLEEIFDVAHASERSRYIDAIHPDDLPIRTQAYERAYKDGLLEYEGRVIRKNGNIGWIRVKGKISLNDDQQPSKLTGVVQDITEEKEFAEELRRQVKERTTELEQFTYVSHHDLQEPLRKISIFIDMIKIESYEQLSEPSRKRLDKVMEAAQRMSRALRDVLNYASLNKEEQFIKTDLGEVVTAVQNDLELALAEKNAIVHSNELPAVNAIPQQMHQLFYNLLNNALKFSKPGVQPTIEIRCESMETGEVQQYADLDPNKSYYRFSVADNGIGFDPQMADRIFVMFQRLHTRETYAGTGIGLALCKKVVVNHKGLIWAESQPGSGSKFQFILPAS